MSVVWDGFDETRLVKEYKLIPKETWATLSGLSFRSFHFAECYNWNGMLVFYSIL